MRLPMIMKAMTHPSSHHPERGFQRFSRMIAIGKPIMIATATIKSKLLIGMSPTSPEPYAKQIRSAKGHPRFYEFTA